MTGDPVLSVCVRCRPAGAPADAPRTGAGLHAAIERSLKAGGSAHADTALREIHCLNQCNRSCVVAFSGTDRFTYLFGDLDPAAHAGDVIAAFDLYRSKADGFLDRAERPEPLRAGILVRLPPLGSTHALVGRSEILGGSPDDRT
jgi:predicted metal-binding protein